MMGCRAGRYGLISSNETGIQDCKVVFLRPIDSPVVIVFIVVVIIVVVVIIEVLLIEMLRTRRSGWYGSWKSRAG